MPVKWGVVLTDGAAHSVQHKIERRDDIHAEAARAGLPVGIARHAWDMTIAVVLKHQAERAVRIKGRWLIEQGDIVGGDDLPVVPPTAAQQAVGEAQGVGRVKGGASRAVGVRHDVVAATQAVRPRSPALRLGEARVDVVRQLHPGDMPQDDRRDVRRRREA